MDPIDEGWRVPNGFPEEYAQRLTQLQYALAEMAVAVRAHASELQQPYADNLLARESQRLAVTITANQLVAGLQALEKAYGKLFEGASLVGRALIRCESYDAGGRLIEGNKANN